MSQPSTSARPPALYAVVTSEAEGARLFVVDPSTGAATRVGTATLPVSGAVSIDFNPTVDLVRVVGEDGTNLRVSPVTGAVTSVDVRLSYTNNDTDPATGTMLFDVDAALDQLALQAPPNDGRLTRVGALGQPTKASATGFDIYTRTSTGTNWAFVTLFDKGRTTSYEIDLATGQPITVTTPVPGSGQDVATRPQVTDIALAPGQTGF